ETGRRPLAMELGRGTPCCCLIMASDSQRGSPFGLPRRSSSAPTIVTSALPEELHDNRRARVVHCLQGEIADDAQHFKDTRNELLVAFKASRCQNRRRPHVHDSYQDPHVMDDIDRHPGLDELFPEMPDGTFWHW